MPGLLDLAAFLFTTGVLPVLVNKSTERGRFDWVHPHLRLIWTAIFGFYSFYLIQKPDSLELVVKIKNSLDVTSPLLGYGICAIIGASVFCGYWWFAGKVFPAIQDTPPALTAIVSDANYPNGTTIGGIVWSSRFADLRVVIENTSSLDWTDLDITILPDEPIAAIGQVTNLPGVVFSNPANLTIQQELVESDTGKRHVNPLVLIATNGGYRLVCDKLLRKQRLEVVIAEAQIKDFPKAGSLPPAPNGGIFNRDYVLKLGIADGANYWYGHGANANGRIEEVYKEQRPIPRVVQLDGRYSVNGLERKIAQHIQVHDLIGGALPKIREEINKTK